jgi:hypothetical protein
MFFVFVLPTLIITSGIPPSIYLDNARQIYHKTVYHKPEHSNAVCTLERIGSRRLIVSLEDDFSPSWLAYRLFDIHHDSFFNLQTSNIEDALALHKSFPCGIGGVHLTPSIIYTTDDIKGLSDKISENFSVTLVEKNGQKTIKPIIAIDFPDEGGWNNRVSMLKFDNCCYDLLKLAGINVLWGPTLDSVYTEEQLDQILSQDLLTTLPRKTIMFFKHFGLERVDETKMTENVDTHKNLVSVKRSQESLEREWRKLTTFAEKNELPTGVMISHVIVSNLENKPLTFSSIVPKLLENTKNVFTVSDSLDMLKNTSPSFNAADWANSVTDLVLWVNYYSGVSFSNVATNEPINPDNLLKISNYLGLIE